jgi:hypothetical protein
METRKIRAMGSKGKINHNVFAWEKTISVRFKDPDRRITGSSANEIETS